MSRDDSKIDNLLPDYFFDVLVLILAFYTDQSIKNNVASEEDPNNSLKEKLIELGKNTEESMALLYRHTVTFTTALIILKGLSIVYIGYHCISPINLPKIFLLGTTFIYFNTLFFKMGSSIKEFKMREIIELCSL